MLINSPLLFINESILAAGTPTSLLLWLPISSLRRNLRRGLIVTYPEIGGLGVELIFNKNVIKLRDNKEYIKEAIDAVAILHAKQRCDCKDDILAHLKASLNRTTKIKPTKIIKLLYS